MKRHVSFVHCSFSKILVGVAGLTALLILIKNILRTEGHGHKGHHTQGPGPGPPDAYKRALKTAADDAPFIDIMREKPKVGSIGFCDIQYSLLVTKVFGWGFG